MVKTTKILLIFMQTFEGNVGKKIFFGVFVGKEENRKGAIKPWPLCTPLGLFFRSAWLLRTGVLLTCVCMLRYSAHYAVPMLFYFFTFSVVRFRQGVCMLRYSARYAVPMLFYFFTFSMVHFWQGVCILRYSVRYALRSLALNLRRGEAGCWW